MFINTGLAEEHHAAYNTLCRLFDRQVANLLGKEIEEFWGIIEKCMVNNVAEMIFQKYTYCGEDERGLSDWLLAERIVHNSEIQPCVAGVFVSNYLFEKVFNGVVSLIMNLPKERMIGERDLISNHRIIDKISQIDERVLSIYLDDLFGGSQDNLYKIFNEVMGRFCNGYFAKKVEESISDEYRKK